MPAVKQSAAMKLKGLLTGFVLFAAAVFWAGCETPLPGKSVVCTSDEIRLGDTIAVSFFVPGSVESIGDKEYQIRSEGIINLPLVGNVKVIDRKFGDVEKELQKLYVPKYYTSISVTVKPRERFYSVGGEVKAPGRQVYLGETTVVRAIVTCGGFTEFASRRKVQILRANGEKELIDCKQALENPRKFDRAICPGDHIEVPRSL